MRRNFLHVQGFAAVAAKGAGAPFQVVFSTQRDRGHRGHIDSSIEVWVRRFLNIGYYSLILDD
jgi:hypothetical protein